MKRCEVGGCFRQPVEKAHIKSKGSGGTNGKHNIINLCVGHHRLDNDCQEHHRDEFYKKYDFVERAEKAYEIEREISQAKRTAHWVRVKQRVKERTPCPYCRKPLPRGFKKRIDEVKRDV